MKTDTHSHRKIIPDSKILKRLIKELGMSNHSFARKLEYGSSMSIYNIINEKEGKHITTDMEARILIHFPQVNPAFLRKGEEPILKQGFSDRVASNLTPLEPSEKRYSIKDVESQLNRIEVQLNRVEGFLTRLEERLNESLALK